MNTCSRCGNSLASNGFCHECYCYDSSIESGDENKFCCELCGCKFSQINDHDSHLLSHPQCPYCKEHFYSKNELVSHVNKHQCPLCGLHFHPIGEHLADVHVFCEICKKWCLDQNSYDEHILIHPQCEFCGKRFEFQCNLNEHIEAVHKCHLCNGYFKNVAKHVDQNHIYCSTCKKYYVGLKEYEAKHPLCKYCGDRIEIKRLDYHMVFSHYCFLCGSYFYPLRNHQIDCHFYSDELEMWFLNKDIYTKISPYFINLKCDICGQKVKSIAGILRHIRNKHTNVYESNIYLNYINNNFYRRHVPFSSMYDIYEGVKSSKKKPY